jgi:hypothetical protein
MELNLSERSHRESLWSQSKEELLKGGGPKWDKQ